MEFDIWTWFGEDDGTRTRNLQLEGLAASPICLRPRMRVKRFELLHKLGLSQSPLPSWATHAEKNDARGRIWTDNLWFLKPTPLAELGYASVQIGNCKF